MGVQSLCHQLLTRAILAKHKHGCGCGRVGALQLQHAAHRHAVPDEFAKVELFVESLAGRHEVRGTGLARSRASLSVETAVSLGERRSLVIVEVENRRLLIGLTPSQISVVTELAPSFKGSLTTALEESPQS